MADLTQSDTPVKTAFTSGTIIGIVVAVVSSLVGKYGYVISPDLQGVAVDSITSIITSIAGAYAVYKRIRASKAIAPAA